jgi:hypothetical protein
VTTVGVTPSRPVVAEDIRDLQNRTRHSAGYAGGASIPFGVSGGEAIQRAHDLADDVGGDLGVARRRLKMGVAERTRVTLITFLRH